ncbi:replication initiation protein [Sporolactobacillus kofuensis]|uniref:Replication initiation protein n=1 Tax=Sporolactobacillus kofuensis TaxID=269672 RepID=A0ABW1WGX0_9BACL|nr:replication initiation protein [Sporolactobacillus kofuensis]MCO7175372.1 replication initiation protein [Sporolactobacillus kofuensis]
MINNPEHYGDKIYLKPIKDRVYWLVRANKLFKETHQKMGIIENQLLFHLIKFCMVETNHPYSHLSVSKVAAILPDFTDDPEQVKAILLKIRNHSFWVTQTEGMKHEVLTNWIQTVIYDHENEEFLIDMSPTLYPYIVCLHERFQTLNYETIMLDSQLKSKYSSRLYELFRIHQGQEIPELTLTLDQLRYLADVGKGKLERWADLKRRVIEPAIEEINQTGTFRITYEPLKSGRSVTQVRFRIKALE